MVKKTKRRVSRRSVARKRIEYFESGKIKTETTFSEGIESGEYIDILKMARKTRSRSI